MRHRISHQLSHQLIRQNLTKPQTGRLIQSYSRRPDPRYPKHASINPYIILLTLTAGATYLIYPNISSEHSKPATSIPNSSDPIALPEQIGPHPPDFSAMPFPEGTINNLTSAQEQKLKEFWTAVLKTFAVIDPNAQQTLPHTATSEAESAKKKGGFFHRKRDSTVEDDDKYGQTKEFQEILGTTKPETLRETFWTMVKDDSPDALLLRFLRARKWDVQKALAMLITTVHWRDKEMKVDEDIMRNGEGGALIDEREGEGVRKTEGRDFLAQLRMGKSFIHGVDKEGRPICVVRVKLHRGGEQSERALERYTVFLIETCRLALTSPVETATIVFDMTGFTMANMDYTPVKFMIKVFEANYPESLGSVLVHNSPWVFNAIWKIIRGWLDPVVAAKVHFTGNVKELEAYIAKENIVKELGGGEDWEYKYVEPREGENDEMKNEERRRELERKRMEIVEKYEMRTFEWIRGEMVERKGLAEEMRLNYWQLDPLVRARSLYDRLGMVGKNGTFDFYPKTQQTQPVPALNGTSTSADDVD